MSIVESIRNLNAAMHKAGVGQVSLILTHAQIRQLMKSPEFKDELMYLGHGVPDAEPRKIGGVGIVTIHGAENIVEPETLASYRRSPKVNTDF